MVNLMKSRRVYWLLVLFMLNGCGEGSSIVQEVRDSESTPWVVNAFYSLYSSNRFGETVLYARAVMNGAEARCPQIVSDQSTQAMTPRLYQPFAMVVKVCEAIISPGVEYSLINVLASSAAVSMTLPAASAAPVNIQVYGDTGCKEDDNNCSGTQGVAIDFQNLANVGASKNPQLLLHVGDYNYRGTTKSQNLVGAYDVKNPADGSDLSCGYDANVAYRSQNAVDSPDQPDQWRFWNVDFFLPAQSILSSAPWVFTRGNHELCSRAGPGWLYFFGPGADISNIPEAMAANQCPAQGSLNPATMGAKGHLLFIEPYFVALDNLRLWVMDSANACDSDANASNSDNTTKYTNQYNELHNDADTNNTWILTHRPLWSYLDEGQGTPAPQANVMLQTALFDSSGMPDNVSLLLAGHEHLFQSLTFNTNHTSSWLPPPQIVIGNSGVGLDGTAYQTSGTATFATGNELEASYNLNNSHHGFLSITMGENGAWTGQVLRQGGEAMVNCALTIPLVGDICTVVR